MRVFRIGVDVWLLWTRGVWFVWVLGAIAEICVTAHEFTIVVSLRSVNITCLHGNIILVFGWWPVLSNLDDIKQ